MEDHQRVSERESKIRRGKKNLKNQFVYFTFREYKTRQKMRGVSLIRLSQYVTRSDGILL